MRQNVLRARAIVVVVVLALLLYASIYGAHDGSIAYGDQPAAFATSMCLGGGLQL